MPSFTYLAREAATGREVRNSLDAASEQAAIVALLRDRLTANAENAGYVLSESFFKTPELFSSGFKSVNQEQKINSQEGKSQGSHFGSVSSSLSKGHIDVQIKKTGRQEMIITILKGQSNLTIKDFSKVIKDCSEKTIQRELIELLEKGVIKKEGERRWSRYSLK